MMYLVFSEGLNEFTLFIYKTKYMQFTWHTLCMLIICTIFCIVSIMTTVSKDTQPCFSQSLTKKCWYKARNRSAKLLQANPNDERTHTHTKQRDRHATTDQTARDTERQSDRRVHCSKQRKRKTESKLGWTSFWNANVSVSCLCSVCACVCSALGFVAMWLCCCIPVPCFNISWHF